MIATSFPEQNKTFGPPKELEESQCRSIGAWKGQVSKGSCDGLPFIITAFKPSVEELAELNAGGSVFVGFISEILPPHLVATSFAAAVNPK